MDNESYKFILRYSSKNVDAISHICIYISSFNFLFYLDLDSSLMVQKIKIIMQIVVIDKTII
jgi:hypothetical protein